MLNTRNVITILLIALGLTLFYLWYSTWHRNISTNSLNKQLIKESINHQRLNTVAVPPNPTDINTNQTPTTTNQTPQSIKPTESINMNKSEKNTKEFVQNKEPVKAKSINIKKNLRKPIRNIVKKPKLLKKPNLLKPIVKRSIVQKPKYSHMYISKKNNSLKLELQKNVKTSEKSIRLNNGTYQAGAFKYFSDALSLSLELKAQGKQTKIIHQNGFYKVIVY